jgi:hypothetical protein
MHSIDGARIFVKEAENISNVSEMLMPDDIFLSQNTFAPNSASALDRSLANNTRFFHFRRSSLPNLWETDGTLRFISPFP